MKTAAYVFTALTLALTVIIVLTVRVIIISRPSDDILLGLLFMGVLDVLFMLGMYYTIITYDNDEIVSFTIFEYERWDDLEEKYLKRYRVGIRWKEKKYVYGKLVKTRETEMSEEEIIKDLMRDDVYGYLELRSAENYIYDLVSNMMKEKVKPEKIIINLKPLSTKSIEEIKAEIKKRHAGKK